MTGLFDTPIFGLLISLITFEIGWFIYAKTKMAIFNPIIIAMTLIIVFLNLFKIDVSYYNKGGDFITFLLGPATVVLAVPLYRKINLLKKYSIPILSGITTASILGLICIIALSALFGLDRELISSILPKSITTAIGIELSKQLGGNQSITIAAITISGITGVVIGPQICRLFKIEDEVAVGIAMGTASHAIGTTKAMELGETQGAMSGLAIGITGIVTVIVAPIIFKLMNFLM